MSKGLSQDDAVPPSQQSVGSVAQSTDGSSAGAGAGAATPSRRGRKTAAGGAAAAVATPSLGIAKRTRRNSVVDGEAAPSVADADATPDIRRVRVGQDDVDAAPAGACSCVVVSWKDPRLLRVAAVGGCRCHCSPRGSCTPSPSAVVCVLSTACCAVPVALFPLTRRRYTGTVVLSIWSERRQGSCCGSGAGGGSGCAPSRCNGEEATQTPSPILRHRVRR